MATREVKAAAPAALGGRDARRGPARRPPAGVPDAQAAGVWLACAGTPSPIGQDTPVEWFGQYPPGFFARYCWW